MRLSSSPGLKRNSVRDCFKTPICGVIPSFACAAYLRRTPPRSLGNALHLGILKQSLNFSHVKFLHLLALTAQFVLAAPCLAQLNVNLFAVNPSETEAREINVKHYLPRELTPQDILDTGALKLAYDVQKGQYYVFEKVQFQPKESKTFKIKVNDVWHIKEEDIDVLKNQLEQNLQALQGKPFYDQAVATRDRLVQQLNEILDMQTGLSQDVGRRIEQYRAHADILEQTRNEIFNITSLEEKAKAGDDVNEAKTVKFIVEVKNPLADAPKTVRHKVFLPQEIKDDDIVEKHGFMYHFDEKTDRPYLSKEETLAPGESKKYEFVLQDVWQMSPSQVDVLKERAENTVEELEGSSYKESGTFLFNAIMEKIAQMQATPAQPSSIEDYIGSFRVNTARFRQATADMERLERLLAIVRAQKLEELESKKVKNVLERLQALRGLAQLSEALFKRGISVTMTWRIIIGAIAFISVFTAWHFFVWSRRSRAMGEEQAPKTGGIVEVPKPGTTENAEAS